METSCSEPGCGSDRVTYYSKIGDQQRASNVPVGGYNTAAGDTRPVVFYGYLCDRHADSHGLLPCAIFRSLDIREAS